MRVIRATDSTTHSPSFVAAEWVRAGEGLGADNKLPLATQIHPDPEKPAFYSQLPKGFCILAAISSG